MKNVHYNQGAEIIEVVIRDSSGSKMQVWRNNIKDSHANTRLIKCLVKKWGMNFDEEDKTLTDLDAEFLKF
jgi:hypothetical protein